MTSTKVPRDLPVKLWRRPAWHLSRGQALVRVTAFLGVGAAVLAAGMVGSVPAWLGCLVVGTALAAVIYPDTLAGWASFIAVGLLWLTEPSGSVTSPWLLLAAAGVIAAHLALLVAAQGPANMRPDGDQLRLWTRRGLRLWAFAVVLWTAERLLHSVPAPTAALIAGLVGLLATAGWIGVHARDEGLPYDWRKP